MKVAFLFPGQGINVVREIVVWYEDSDSVRRLVDLATRHAGTSVEEIFAQGGRALSRTDILQPVLTATCLAIYEELVDRGILPDIVAGHSLGEIAACSVAGCMDTEDAVALAAERGRLMARQAERHPGGMVALTASNRETVEEAIKAAEKHGIVALAGHSAPGQWVVSGEWAALRIIQKQFAATLIPVAGPWHCAAMTDAVDEFRAAARRFASGTLRIPLVSNRTGRIAEHGQDIPDLLAEQLTHPVQWERSMRTMAQCEVTDYVTVGPGKVLRGLVRQNLGSGTSLHMAEMPRILESTLEALAQ